MKLSLQISFAVLLFVFLISGCSIFDESENFTSIEAIEYGPVLESETYSFDGQMNILRSGQMINFNDLFLIVSDAEEDAIFKVFSLPELDYLYSWGSIGSGPDEFRHVPINQVNVSNNQIIIYELGTQDLVSYEVTDSTFNYSGREELNYDGQHGILSGIKKLNDSKYIAEYGTGLEDTNYEFIALEPGNSTPLYKFGEYPETGLAEHERYFNYRKTTALSFKREKFAAFYLHQNKFKIFDDEGNLVDMFQIIDEYSDSTPSDQFLYRTAKEVSDQFIYTFGIHEKRESLSEINENFFPSLEIWDWEGRQIFRAKFDRHISDFVVSEKHQKIYAYSEHDITSLFVYDLPDVSE